MSKAFIREIYIYHKAKLANRFYWSITYCISCAIRNSIIQFCLVSTRNQRQQNGPRDIVGVNGVFISSAKLFVFCAIERQIKAVGLSISLNSVFLKWRRSAKSRQTLWQLPYVLKKKYIVSYPILAGLVPPIIIWQNLLRGQFEFNNLCVLLRRDPSRSIEAILAP